MLVCVWYTEPTCIPQSRLVYRIGPLEQTLWVRSSVIVHVDRWLGHSRCRAPLTTGVDIYPRVLPSAYCVLVAGPLPLQSTLDHWGRILPQGLTIQNEKEAISNAYQIPPAGQQSIIKDLYQNAKSQRKPVDWPIKALYIYIHKSHGIIKNYKGK